MVRAEHGFGQCFSPVAHRVLALRSDRLSKDYLRKKDALRSVHKLDVAPGKRGDDNSSRGRILASSSKLCSHCVPSSSRVVTRIFGKSRLLIAWGGFGLSLPHHEICDRRKRLSFRASSRSIAPRSFLATGSSQGTPTARASSGYRKTPRKTMRIPISRPTARTR